jgi:signal transduction histidine kinase
MLPAEADVVDALADGVAVVDCRGRVVLWNRAAARMTGRPAEDVVGGPLPFPAGPLDEAVEHPLAGDLWIEAVATELPSRDGVVHCFRDVTRHKALDEAKDLFLATMSHELKTPLTVIKGFASTLREHGRDLTEAERDEAIETIVRRADRLVALIEQILLGGRTEAYRYDVVLGPVDVGLSVRLVAADFRDVSPAHRLEVDVPSDLPVALADRTAVEQALGQLLENAFKYSPDGGTVRVSARAGEGRVVVSVSDEGIGLEPGQHEQVFRRFWQADAGSSRRFGGVGLGLFIVRRLVERQGGEVWAEGEPGRGATFSFALPTA